MKFSMIFEAQMADDRPENERTVIHDCVDQAVLAEQCGFDGVWAVEHHSLRWYAHMSAPEVFLSYVAARTERVALGHGCVLMPFGYNHPVRVGERVAMLDVLSGGRLHVGGGRGATQQEMSLLGVDPADTYPQLEETLRMLSRMWVDDEFTWRSDSMTIDPHPILPRPVQRPHPPLYLACTKDSTLETAAELGVGALVLGFKGPDEVARLNEVYRTAIERRTGERLVSSVVNDHFAALCPTIVLDDGEQAFRIGARAQQFFAEAIGHWYANGPLPSFEPLRDDQDVLASVDAARQRYTAHLSEAEIPVSPNATATYNVGHAYGTADVAVDYVKQLQAAGADEILCLIQMGFVPQDVALETIRQWGETVIPHFRRPDTDGDGAGDGTGVGAATAATVAGA